MTDIRVDFRRLVDDDLELLHGWLNEPGVVRWWEGSDVSWDAVVREYGADASDPTEHWLASAEHRPVGWIQTYAAADFAHEGEVQAWFTHGVDRTAAGIDYLVGDPADRGRGVGGAMIDAFVDRVVFGAHPQWTQVCASPLVANAASWQALRSAGFAHVTDFEDPLGPCRLMVRDRPSSA